MYRILLIGVAGLLGTLARFGLSGLIARRFDETFPTGTLIVNVVGCFLAGFLFYLLQERFEVDAVWRTTVLVGFLGGFTTFSAFGLQTITLLRDGEVFLAATNIALSNVLGLLAVWLGYSLGRQVQI